LVLITSVEVGTFHDMQFKICILMYFINYNLEVCTDHTQNTSASKNITTRYQQQIFQPTRKAILLLCLILNM